MGIHTIDTASKEYMKWVKMNTITGEIKVAKGSWSGSTYERPNRKRASHFHNEDQISRVPILRKMPAANTWTAAIAKLDANLDVVNYHYIQETLANMNHDLTVIKVSRNDRDTLFLGGNLDIGSRDAAIITKVKEVTTNLNT
jgi:hypothetical protein